ncbi:MAG: heme exporter protein CcmD [SAR202 cluster bacterium]|nr:heme exporter protein CcmD [SAR202 cluster bacterium]
MFDTPANNIPYLFAAYAIAWAVFFGFAFMAWRRHHEVEREVRALREELRRRDKEGGTSTR